MGTRILSLAAEAEDLAIVAAVERADHPGLGKDAGTLLLGKTLGVPLTPRLEVEADCLVDFSHPSATVPRLAECRRTKTAIVVGTTGLDPGVERAAEEASREIPVLLSTNMSLGVHLLLALAEEAARRLGPEFDVEVIEVHHRQKKDSPSGTALTIARTLAQAMGVDLEKAAAHGRKGNVGPRPVSEIGIHAVRGGDVVGEHTVLFAGEGERIELVHKASSRDTFARGALRAARFLAGRPPGRYTMANVLSWNVNRHSGS
ncbi:MAG: 4-hydroxy-tetrahydrodipicolinate reductase [Planctomycetes bacterium]|nr:4-hydroxy-tetrahydrodipicolinate reductase [Planctomycetota bacterium]